MTGLKRGILGGLVLAVIVFFLPDGLLGMLTVRSGLSSIVPATAPPLGTTARLLLAAGGFVVGFALTFWLVRRRRNEWDIDDGFETDAAPLPAAEQMAPAPAPSPRAEPSAARPADDRLDARLRQLEATVAALPTPSGGGDVLGGRVDEIEMRLAAIEARLAERPDEAAEFRIARRADARVGRALADIRRSIDGG